MKRSTSPEPMMKDGVQVELHHIPRTFHAFDVAVPQSALAKRAIAGQCGALAAAFRGEVATT